MSEHIQQKKPEFTIRGGNLVQSFLLSSLVENKDKLD